MSLLTKNKRTIEEVVNIVCANGSDGSSERFQPPAGVIRRAVLVFTPTVPNPGFVSFYMNDAAGTEIIKAQHIDMMRTREVVYENDGKALNLDTKNRYFIAAIQADQNFTAQFRVSLVLIYEPEFEENCEIQN